ncbi:MAG: hypothetical protein KDK25_11385, partial [Leptospiraceae bacterium]|nr:hypothetical protein [Leptospiraceae bacterium]
WQKIPRNGRSLKDLHPPGTARPSIPIPAAVGETPQIPATLHFFPHSHAICGVHADLRGSSMASPLTKDLNILFA